MHHHLTPVKHFSHLFFENLFKKQPNHLTPHPTKKPAPRESAHYRDSNQKVKKKMKYPR